MDIALLIINSLFCMGAERRRRKKNERFLFVLPAPSFKIPYSVPLREDSVYEH